MHTCISKLTTIGSDNGLSSGRRQAIIWINALILLIWTLATNFSEILSKINKFSFKKMHLNMSSEKCRLFCLSINELSYSVEMTGALCHVCMWSHPVHHLLCSCIRLPKTPIMSYMHAGTQWSKTINLTGRDILRNMYIAIHLLMFACGLWIRSIHRFILAQELIRRFD